MQISEELSLEQMEANALLRERFLYFISTICGDRVCKVKMHENTEVTCKLKAFDLNFENIAVENLTTPQPAVIKKAILRTSDIISITIPEK